MTPAPYLTGDMPSSAAAVNAIVGGSGREAVVAGSVPSRILPTPPTGVRDGLGLWMRPRTIPLLTQARRNHSPSAGQPFNVSAPKIT